MNLIFPVALSVFSIASGWCWHDTMARDMNTATSHFVRISTVLQNKLSLMVCNRIPMRKKPIALIRSMVLSLA